MTELLKSTSNTIYRYASASNILIAATILAVVCANVPGVRELYNFLWTIPVTLDIGGFNLFAHHGETMSLGAFINDALMTIFFFTVGLEIKREMLVGELSSIKKALLPIIGACGGMLMPVLVFYAVASTEADGAQYLRGCAIPMATDIAFSLAVITMLGDRVPVAIKVFLTTLAVADDLGGIIVIATCYSTGLAYSYLALGLVLLLITAIAGGYFKVRKKVFYVVMGVIIWYLFLNTGIHPTIAGVCVAFCVPSEPKLTPSRYIQALKESISELTVSTNLNEKVMFSDKQLDTLQDIELRASRMVSPLQQFENMLQTPVNFVILPLFAFSSAGIYLLDMNPGSIFGGVSLAVMLGLVIGKCTGIFIASWLSIVLGIAEKPEGSTWSMLASVAMVGGIGFTVSLFIATLSFDPVAHASILNNAKMGIVLGSLISGFLGYFMLKCTTKKQ